MTGISVLDAAAALDRIDDEPEAVEAPAAPQPKPDKKTQPAAKAADPVEDDGAAQAETDEIAEADESGADADQGEPEEASAEDDEGGDKGEADDLPPIDPPQFLDPNERETFKTLPRAAQELLAKHDRSLVADYTRKTQELASQRKVVTSRLEKLAEVHTEREQRIKEWGAVDWRKVRAEHGVDYMLDLQAQRDEEMAEYQALDEQLKTEQASTFRDHVTVQSERLAAIRPDLAGETGKVRRQEITNAIAAALQSEGLDTDTIRERIRWLSAFEVSFVDKALKWDAYQAQKSQKPAITPKPDAKSKGKPVRPAARPSSSSTPAAKTVSTFKKAPSVQNAISALLEMDD